MSIYIYIYIHVELMRNSTQHDSQYEKACQCGKDRHKSEYQTLPVGHFLDDGAQASLLLLLQRLSEEGRQWAAVDCCQYGASGTLLDGLGWILLANEDLQEPQFGFNALVLFVFVHHGHAVFLLNSPVGGGGIETFRLRTMLMWWRQNWFVFNHWACVVNGSSTAV